MNESDVTLTWGRSEELADALALESAASAPYTQFVFSAESQAIAARHYLLERGIAEFSPPYLRLLRLDGQVVGMLAALTGTELRRRRLRAAAALSEAKFFAGDEDAARRVRLAGQTLLKVRPDDYYISRIAMTPELQGRGLGKLLLQSAEQTARDRGCPRVVLEVSSLSVAALQFYQRAGYTEVGSERVEDASSGRQLEYRHMVKSLGAPASRSDGERAGE